jgi:hypothetical protein
MKQFAKKAALVILTGAAIVGCQKDDNNNNGGSTKTQLITTGSWKLTSDYIDPAVDVNGDGVADHEVFNFYDDCSKDDMLTFKSNGTLTFDEGPTKCDPTDPQSENTTWKFGSNETQLIVGSAGSEETVQLIELSTTALKIRTSSTVAGVVYTETMTYKH